MLQETISISFKSPACFRRWNGIWIVLWLRSEATNPVYQLLSSCISNVRDRVREEELLSMSCHDLTISFSRDQGKARWKAYVAPERNLDRSQQPRHSKRPENLGGPSLGYRMLLTLELMPSEATSKDDLTVSGAE